MYRESHLLSGYQYKTKKTEIKEQKLAEKEKRAVQKTILFFHIKEKIMR